MSLSCGLGLEPNLISGLPQLSTMTCLEICGKSSGKQQESDAAHAGNLNDLVG